ncbi:MAG: HEPN domain-containing protein [Actinomycetota bacterium]|nr:HEPN domain-containing protein [Actinomycetota bacterium]
MAILLEEDPSKRLKLQRRLKKIYDLRSKVAHGGRTTPKDKIGERRVEAERFALEALRILFSTRVMLLQKDDRGMRLQLGIPDEADLD